MNKECETSHSDECGMSTLEKQQGSLKELEHDVVIIEDIYCDHNNQPGMNDFDDRPKKGKKGKYLKDWE